MDSEILEQHKELLKLQQQAKERAPEIIKNLYESGTIASVPESQKRNSLADGWFTTLINRSELSDIWLVEAESGYVLDSHNHPKNMEIVLLLKGSCIFKIQGSEEQQLSPLQSIIIPPGVEHSVTATRESRMVVVFQPPLSDPEFTAPID